MKKILISTLWLFFLLNTSFATIDTGRMVSLKCKLSHCEANTDSLYLFQFDGIIFHKVKSVAKVKKGIYNEYEFKLRLLRPDYFFVGFSNNDLKLIILGAENEVKLDGNCKRMRAAKITSKYNDGYIRLKNRMNAFGREGNILANQIRSNYNNPALKEELIKKEADLDKRKLAFLDSLKRANPFFAKIVAVNTFLSFENHGTNYRSGVLYFVNEYFKYADWSDETYNTSPWVYESFRAFAGTIAGIGLKEAQKKAYIETGLEKTKPYPAVYKLALGGVLSALQKAQSSVYAYFAQKFLDKFGKTDLTAAVIIKQQMKRLHGIVMGAEAPDFEMMTPDGTMVKLSSLRGKVVLIDFWASWCGPCRREIPNIVKLYKKYKSHGFEVLGVSLDRTKSKWTDFIAKDKMDWLHVSDLKGWKNGVAKLYGVRSIPDTFLLDKEGKIIGRKLRGKGLEAKLKEVFGF